MPRYDTSKPLMISSQWLWKNGASFDVIAAFRKNMARLKEQGKDVGSAFFRTFQVSREHLLGAPFTYVAWLARSLLTEVEETAWYSELDAGSEDAGSLLAGVLKLPTKLPPPQAFAPLPPQSSLLPYLKPAAVRVYREEDDPDRIVHVIEPDFAEA